MASSLLEFICGLEEKFILYLQFCGPALTFERNGIICWRMNPSGSISDDHTYSVRRDGCRRISSAFDARDATLPCRSAYDLGEYEFDNDCIFAGSIDTQKECGAEFCI